MNKPERMSPFMLDPEHVPAELDQAEWYRTVWLPNALKALKGEAHDRDLLAGSGAAQANDDQQWDSRSEGNWE